MRIQSYLFSVLYIVYLLICEFWSTYPLFGNVTIRHATTLIMLVVCFISGTRKFDWFLILFCVFVICYFIANLITGYGGIALNKLFGTYLAVIVIYLATKTMVIKYDNIKIVALVLFTIFLLDAIVTIAQYYQMPLAIELPYVLGIELDGDFTDLLGKGQTMEGFVVQGLYGAVKNGYVLSAAVVLSWYPFKNRYFRWILNYISCAVCMIASFYAQERTGFFVSVILCLYILFKQVQIKRGLNRFLLFAILAFLLIFLRDLLNYVLSTGRYQMELTVSERYELASQGWKFILENPLGGVDLFRNTHPKMPHNLFVNMFLAGGLLGGICLLTIVVKQLYRIIRYLHHYNNISKLLPMLFALLYISFTANSFSHNLSFVYGEPLCFVFWGVCACYMDKNMPSLDNRITMR